MTEPAPASPDSPPSAPFRRRTRAGLPWTRWFLVLALIGLTGAGWYFLTRVSLVFTNQLAGPVRVTIGQDSPLTLAPGQTVRVAISRGQTMVALWELVRPLSADRRPMGSELRGSVVVREPRGTLLRSASARGPDADYFAPLITNASDELLRVRVNAGLEGALDCGCAVRPAARRVFIGYYPLYQNSTVQAIASDSRSATFRDLGPSVTAPDGTVGLRFETKDLRRP